MAGKLTSSLLKPPDTTKENRLRQALPGLGVSGLGFSISQYREWEAEQKRKRKEEAQKKLRQMEYDRLEKLRQAGVMRALPTADPDAASEEYRKRASAAYDEMQRRTFGQYLPKLLGGMNASYARAGKDNKVVERYQLEKDISTRVQTPEYQQSMASDPMLEYQRLCRQMGADKVGERMAGIKTMWDTYSLMYDGSDVIWELTKSPFAMPEIKNMLDEMHYLMYQDYDRYTFRENMADELWVKWRDTYGMKAKQYEPFRELFEAQRVNEMPSQWEQGDKLGAILTMSMFIPIPGLGWASAVKNTTNAVRALTTAGKVLTTGEKLVQGAKALGTGAAEIAAKATVPAVKAAKFGGKFTALTYTIGGLGEIEETKRLEAIADKQEQANQALELASNPAAALLTTSLGLDLPEPFQEIRNLKDDLAQIANEVDDRDAVIQLMKDWQELGIGTDLPADGVLSWEWQEEIINAAEEGVRAVFDEQRLAIEEGDADYWAAINGNMEDPYWVDVFARRKERQDLSDQAKIENYSKWMWYERSGIPRNSLEAKALGRRLAENGWIQALYGGLLQTALTIGQVVDATASAVNLSVRQSKDPEYQRLIADLNEYIDSLELSYVVGGYDGQPTKSNEGFALIQAGTPNGPLASDPIAQEKLTALKLRQAQLIYEDYDADILETLGLTFGTSPQRMRQFELDHPDIVHAFTAGVWIATAKVNPVGRIYRGAFKPTVRANMAAFLDSARAKRIVSRVTNYLAAGDAGRAISYIKGTGAAQLLNRWWALSGKTAKQVSADSQIIRDVANEIVRAVDDGAPQRVATILKGADDATIDGVVNQLNTGYARGLTRAQAQGWVGSVAERNMAVNLMSRYIAKQHNRGEKVITDEVLNTRLMERFSVEYAKGADIFPYLRDNKILPPNRILGALTKKLSQVPNEWFRDFLTKWTVGLITRAPTAEIELRGLNTLDRVYDAALLISQDAAWAWNFRNRWATAKSQGQYLKLADQLTAKFDSKFIGRNSHTDVSIRERVQQALGVEREYEGGGQALAPEPYPIPTRAGEAQMLTQWTIPKQPGRPARIAQALPDTVYQQYLVSLHRSALWAPYRLPKLDGMGSYFKAGPVAVKNIYRLFLGGMHRVSTPLRQWTVAMGAPLLFQKHAITDSFRTYMETGATSLLEAMGFKGLTVRGHTLLPKIRTYHARRVESIMSEISPSLRDEILYSKARVHASEAQWLSGSSQQVYRPKTIRDKNGNINDLDGSAHALRRILEGEAFKQYAAGGAPAVQAWLLTTAGKRFMREGGWTKRAKDIITEQYHGRVIPEGLLKADSIMERARLDYMEDIVSREFARLDEALPHIMPTLKDMAINDKVWDINRIKKLITDNPRDNAVLSMPAHMYGSNTMAGYITGKAMSANKWNRDVVFDHIFIREFNKLKREGIEAEYAAQTAATIAELNTSRIHFDLSNALAVEARHRWFAWFATKHRLFGTYMMKLAIERPTIAAVVPEIMHWMEERNEKQGVGEFDKYDLVITRADGSQWRFNLAPYMWFAEFPLESSAAIALEKTAEWFGDKYMGFSVPSSPTPFGLTFTRADSLFLNLYYVLGSDSAVKQPEFFLETKAATTQEQAERMAEESLTNWLNSLGESQRLRFRRLINNARAYSIARGDNWTALQAFNEIKWGILTDEFMKCCKLYSGRKMGADELEVERLLREYADLTAAGDEEAAQALMQNEPALAAAFNATMDPVEKQELDEGWRIFNQFREDCTKALEAADENGTLINRYDDILEEFAGNMDRIVNPAYEGGDNSVYNPTFAKYFGSMRNISTPQEFLDSLGFLMPMVSAEDVWNQGRAKTSTEIAEHRDALIENDFKPALLKAGLVYGSDSSQPLYQQLKQQYVDDPMIEWSGEGEYQLTPYKAMTAARYLARGGETGPGRADAFLDLVSDRTLQQWVSKGIGTTGVPINPLMALLTDEQLGIIDWTRAPGVTDAWREWAEMDWLIKYARKTTPRTEEGKEGFGISSSSTLYKQMKADNLIPLEEKLKASVDGYNDEYDFSKLKLHERLIVLGVGSGDDVVSKQYAQFLAICADYWMELDQADNPNSKEPGISPVSQAAKPIWEKYIKKVAQLAFPTGDPEKPSEWWQFFRGTFGISKFGFTRTWAVSDKTVTALLWGDEDMPADETEEYWYK